MHACRTEVTPSPRLKAPIPRVLATFVSTPFGVFLYGGARQIASTPNARAPLCDLWHLKLDDSKRSSAQPVYVWEDCNKVPMCAVEHTVASDAGTSMPSTSAGERVVVGHDAHAAAFVEPSHLVVCYFSTSAPPCTCGMTVLHCVLPYFSGKERIHNCDQSQGSCASTPHLMATRGPWKGFESLVERMYAVQVWSGMLGRMPKRGVLASVPPPPQLTGNLFAIDLAAIDRGWSMVPAARLNSADSGIGPVVPRRWAAMAALGPGAVAPPLPTPTLLAFLQ
jgi:hypothetical protein